MSKQADYVKKAHDKQLANGWVRKGLRLRPMAAMDLEREMARTGLTASQVISDLLKKTRPQ